LHSQEERLMSQLTVLVLIVGTVVLALAIAWMYFRQKRSKDLRSHFGSEYDRLVHEKGNRGRAETELGQRESRVKRLAIRPLTREVSLRFAKLWTDQQSRFVDEPNAAVAEAGYLVKAVMKERGYPVGEFDQRAADISVDHPRLVENYRAAHRTMGVLKRVRHRNDLYIRVQGTHRCVKRDLCCRPGAQVLYHIQQCSEHTMIN
jgi:hypothetical protein